MCVDVCKYVYMNADDVCACRACVVVLTQGLRESGLLRAEEVEVPRGSIVLKRAIPLTLLLCRKRRDSISLAPVAL